MSMSTHVIGFKPPDAKWTAMKNAWDACKAAGIPVPDAVHEFFGYDTPDPLGVFVTEKDLVKCGALREWRDECRDGYEVVVANLPPDVTVVRVYNSWLQKPNGAPPRTPLGCCQVEPTSHRYHERAGPAREAARDEQR